MSGIPSRRHPFKSSHFHDIFRGTTTGTGYHTTQPGPSFPTIDDSPSDAPESTESTTKKRTTRLPLFGRSRKKSTHSDIAPGTSSRPSESQSGRGSTATHASRHERSSLHARASTSQPSLLAVSTQPTLSSKIVAHFTPRKSRKHKSTPSLSQSEEVSDSPSHIPSLPSAPTIRPSTESTRSREDRQSLNGRRQPGTPTLRQTRTGGLAQPTITVSHPDSDDLSEYEDLFTKPRQNSKPKPAPLQIPPLKQKPRNRIRDSSTSTTSSSPSSPNTSTDPALSERGTHSSATTTPTHETPTPTGSPAEISILAASTSVAADKVAEKRLRDDSTCGENQSFKSPSSSLRTKPISRVTPTATDTELYSTAEESDAMSVMSMPALGASSFTRRRKTSHQTSDNINRVSPTLSYRLERGRTMTLAPSSKPPSRPLPPPPNNGGRPRANTLLTLSLSQSSNPPGTTLKCPSSASSKRLLPSPPTPPPKDDSVPSEAPQSSINTDNRSSQSSSDSSSSTQTLTKTNIPHIQPLGIQIDTASADELRLGLRQRNMQLDNLANYIKNVTEIHAQEKLQLEKRIADLERDIMRRDKEIKGLGWLMRNGNEQASNTTRPLATPDLDKERSDDSSTHSMRLATPSSSIRLPLYRRLNADDSGAESYATSGAESIDKGSATSGADSWEVSPKPRRAMRKLKLVETFNNTTPLSRPLALRQAEGKTIEALQRSSMSSVYSTSSSGSSPFSSPTSVAFACAGLTSIPETPSRPRTTSGISLPKDKKVERERKLSNVSNSSSNTTSAPSKSKPTSSRLTPSEAYARNLVKDRPPSIAQILNSGNQNTPTAPIMQESFGGRSRALLGLVHKKS
ncbi:hypothetical protein E1B28_006387 [Marasmius oreades]|uniref:Uncharacterized protein n=1 Tax=Marasmius oreades TaxID=181124 RepID=A0A9P7S5I3_9AGAR|nr:uncharacterized protein E1B28_006387 [Marasmius oreades]KAG7095670.1 hypothetical protein E1B28_006387 [Marasmius oreades]